MDVIKAIISGATTLEAVKQQTSATMGAGCCEQQIKRLIDCLCAPGLRKRRKKKKK